MYCLTLGTIQQPPVRDYVLWRERSGQVNQLGQDLLLATREQVQVSKICSVAGKNILKNQKNCSRTSSDMTEQVQSPER